MNPFTLEFQPLPVWYRLALEHAGTPTVIVRTRPEIEKVVIADLSTEEYDIGQYRKRFSFGPFVSPRHGSWGFPSASGPLSAQTIHDEGGWTVWRFPLPHIGLGGDKKPDWDTAYALGATLAVFWTALDRGANALEENVTGPRQLLRVMTTVRSTGMCSATIGATVSQEARRRLPLAFLNEAAASIIGAMHATCDHLWGKAIDDPTYEFGAYLDDSGLLQLRMPMGNAVGLAPEWPIRDEHGYTLGGHNTDTPLHQFVLLAGLCRLHEHLERFEASPVSP